MVKFRAPQNTKGIADLYIYIPLWLNSEIRDTANQHFFMPHLHSTMVKFRVLSYSLKTSNWNHLHSTMVKFRVYHQEEDHRRWQLIYIPLWLNSELSISLILVFNLHNLHSTMVKFRGSFRTNETGLRRFTFHYG